MANDEDYDSLTFVIEDEADQVGGRQRWAKAAEAIFAEVKNAAPGSKEKVLHEAAQRLGLSAQTLRRAVSSYEFAQDVEQKWTVDLKSAPLNSVEHIKRWAGYDEAGAKEAALLAVTNRASAEQLAVLELEARPNPDANTPPRVAKANQRKLIEAELAKEVGGSIVPDPFVDFSVRPGKDYRTFRHFHKPDPKRGKIKSDLIGVMIFKPRERQEENQQSAVKTLALANGLTDLYTELRIYVIGDMKAEEFLGYGRRCRLNLDSVRVLEPKMETLTHESEPESPDSGPGRR